MRSIFFYVEKVELAANVNFKLNVIFHLYDCIWQTSVAPVNIVNYHKCINGKS